MDLTFFENTPFFPTNSLQGEKNSEGNFWHFSSEIVNSTTLPSIPISKSNPSHSENLSLSRVENFDVDDESNKQGKNLNAKNNQEKNNVPNLDA